MKIQLGALMDGVMRTKAQLDQQDAQSRINQMNDLRIRDAKRNQDQVDEYDKFRAAAARSFTAAQQPDTGAPQSDVPMATGGADSRPQVSAATAAQFGTSRENQQPTVAQPVQSQRTDGSSDPSRVTDLEAAQTSGVSPRNIQANSLPTASNTPDERLANADAFRAAEHGASNTSASAPYTTDIQATPSSSPMVASLGVNPQQGQGIAVPGRGVRPPAQQAPAQQPQQAGASPLDLHRHILQEAMKSGNPRFVKSASDDYMTALSADAQQANGEFSLKNRAALQALQQGQLDEAGKQQLYGAQAAHLQRYAGTLGHVAALTMMNPDSEQIGPLLQTITGTKKAAGIVQMNDTSAGPDGRPVTTPMAVVVDSEGKPLQTSTGHDFKMPLQQFHNLALSSPLAAMLRPPMVDTNVVSLGDGQGVVYDKQHPIGQAPTVTPIGQTTGGVRDERMANIREKIITPALSTLDTRMRQPPGPLGSLGALKPEYENLYEPAKALVERMAADAHSAGGAQAVQPQAIAKRVGELADRVLAMRKAGNPKYSLEDAVRDGIGGGKPTQGGGGNSVADVLSRFGVR